MVGWPPKTINSRNPSCIKEKMAVYIMQSGFAFDVIIVTAQEALSE
jgi:hypothetical protein